MSPSSRRAVTGAAERILPDIANVELLPGVRWKQQNLIQLKRIHPKKFAE